jgi:putative antitoxin of VapBC-like toxin-antitoxin system
MRTTLDIDEDVLQAAKEIGAMRGKSAGQIISEMARKAMMSPSSATERNGVPLLPRRGRIVTVEMVERLLDQP